MNILRKTVITFGAAAALALGLSGAAIAQTFPGQGFFPQDGQIVATIYQGCGGEPRCMAAAWATVEVSRCRQGLGVPGGCFGPNGEIMKITNHFVPRHLQLPVVMGNIGSDLRNGPGASNDVTGRNGWLRRRFGI